MLEDAYLSAGFVCMEKSIVLFTTNMGERKTLRDFCAFYLSFLLGKAGGAWRGSIVEERLFLSSR